MDNTKLIAALEGATGPDRLLDAMLESERQRRKDDDPKAKRWIPDKRGHVQRGAVKYAAPAYTANVDSAITFVPEGMRRRCAVMEDGRAGVQLCWPADQWEGPLGQLYANEAIATLVAALKEADE